MNPRFNIENASFNDIQKQKKALQLEIERIEQAIETKRVESIASVGAYLASVMTSKTNTQAIKDKRDKISQVFITLVKEGVYKDKKMALDMLLAASQGDDTMFEQLQNETGLHSESATLQSPKPRGRAAQQQRNDADETE